MHWLRLPFLRESRASFRGSQGPGARLDQAVDGELFKDASVAPQEPEILKTSGYIGCGIDGNTHHGYLAPGIFQVRNPKNNGALVETSLVWSG